MSQPKVNPTRQSGPQAHPAPKNPRDVDMKPGGPIMPSKQGYENPGPTPNLRGVEPNTAMHRGTPNPEQSGTPGKHGDHNPGFSDDVHGHNVPTPIQGNHGVKKHHGKPINLDAIKPGNFARHEGEVK